MYKKFRAKASRTGLDINNSYPGERIEDKVARIVNNKEPIKDGAPLIYHERKDGLDPKCDIRTDRFDVAMEVQDKYARHKWAKRADLKPIEGGKGETPTQQTTDANSNTSGEAK